MERQLVCPRKPICHFKFYLTSRHWKVNQIVSFSRELNLEIQQHRSENGFKWNFKWPGGFIAGVAKWSIVTQLLPVVHAHTHPHTRECGSVVNKPGRRVYWLYTSCPYVFTQFPFPHFCFRDQRMKWSRDQFLSLSVRPPLLRMFGMQGEASRRCSPSLRSNPPLFWQPSNFTTDA